MLHESSIASIRNYVRLGILCGSMTVIFYFIAIIPSLMIPCILSVILYYILNPFVNFLERTGSKRSTATLLALVLFCTPLFVLSSYCMTGMEDEISTLGEELPTYSIKVEAKIKNIELKLSQKVSFLKNTELTEQFMSWARAVSHDLLVKTPEFLSILLWVLFFAPMVTYFLLKDGHGLSKWLLGLIPNRHFEIAYNIGHQISKKTGGYIIAKLGECVIVGILTAIGLYIIDFPYIILLAVFAGITNIIPYFGPAVGTIPAIFVALFEPNSASILVYVLLVYGVVHFIDGMILFPVLVSKIIDLHPLYVLFAFVVGGSVGGIIGLLLAIPVAAIVKVMIAETLGISSKDSYFV